MLPKRVFLDFIQRVFVMDGMKINKHIYWSNKRSMLSRLGDWGEWKSSPLNTVANGEQKRWNCLYLGINGTETWTQYHPGICEPTILLIQEHGLFNHQW